VEVASYAPPRHFGWLLSPKHIASQLPVRWKLDASLWPALALPLPTAWFATQFEVRSRWSLICSIRRGELWSRAQVCSSTLEAASGHAAASRCWHALTATLQFTEKDRCASCCSLAQLTVPEASSCPVSGSRGGLSESDRRCSMMLGKGGGRVCWSHVHDMCLSHSSWELHIASSSINHSQVGYSFMPPWKHKSERQREKERNRPSRHVRLGLPKPPPRRPRQHAQQQHSEQHSEQEHSEQQHSEQRESHSFTPRTPPKAQPRKRSHAEDTQARGEPQAAAVAGSSSGRSRQQACLGSAVPKTPPKAPPRKKQSVPITLQTPSVRDQWETRRETRDTQQQRASGSRDGDDLSTEVSVTYPPVPPPESPPPPIACIPSVVSQSRPRLWALATRETVDWQ